MELRTRILKKSDDYFCGNGGDVVTEVIVFTKQKQFAKGNKIASIQAKEERQLNWLDIKAKRKQERQAKRKKYTL